MRKALRGEVWLVDLGFTAKVRPCVVFSVPFGDDDRSVLTLVPHTTSLRGTKFEAALAVRFLKTGAFDAQGLITVPPAYLIRKLGVLSASQVRSVEAVVQLWLGLDRAMFRD